MNMKTALENLKEWQASIAPAAEVVVFNTAGRDAAIRVALAPGSGCTTAEVMEATGLSRTRLYQIKKGGASDE